MEHGLAGIYWREEIHNVNPVWGPFDSCEQKKYGAVLELGSEGKEHSGEGLADQKGWPPFLSLIFAFGWIFKEPYVAKDPV